MKIIIKTLQGKQLPLEVEETNTVSTIVEVDSMKDLASEAKDLG
jgi:hypothetical protein